MSTIRCLPAQNKRVETGPVQFGEDWPGVFIRGDNAAYYAHHLLAMLTGKGRVTNSIDRLMLLAIYQELRACQVGPAATLFTDPGSGNALEKESP